MIKAYRESTKRMTVMRMESGKSLVNSARLSILKGPPGRNFSASLSEDPWIV
jgi:hypothetical protein